MNVAEMEWAPAAPSREPHQSVDRPDVDYPQRSREFQDALARQQPEIKHREGSDIDPAPRREQAETPASQRQGVTNRKTETNTPSKSTAQKAVAPDAKQQPGPVVSNPTAETGEPIVDAVETAAAVSQVNGKGTEMMPQNSMLQVAEVASETEISKADAAPVPTATPIAVSDVLLWGVARAAEALAQAETDQSTTTPQIANLPQAEADPAITTSPVAVLPQANAGQAATGTQIIALTQTEAGQATVDTPPIAGLSQTTGATALQQLANPPLAAQTQPGGEGALPVPTQLNATATLTPQMEEMVRQAVNRASQANQATHTADEASGPTPEITQNAKLGETEADANSLMKGDKPSGDGDESQIKAAKAAAKGAMNGAYKAGNAEPLNLSQAAPTGTGDVARSPVVQLAQSTVMRAPEELSKPGFGPAADKVQSAPLGSASQEPGATQEVKSPRAVTPTQRTELFDQVMDRTTRMMRVGEREATLQLQPEHLGELKIKVVMERGGGVTAELVAQSQMTRDLLEQNQSRLQQALLDSGADSAQVDVSLERDNQAGQQQHTERQAERQAEPKSVGDSHSATPTHAAPMVAGSGLSIRA